MKEVTNNQLFEYMTMMYGEVVEIKNELSDFKQKSAVFEEKTEQRFKALFEGYEAHTEAIGRLEVATTVNTEKIERLEVATLMNTEKIERLEVTTLMNTEAIKGLTHEVGDLKKMVSHHEVKLKIIK